MAEPDIIVSGWKNTSRWSTELLPGNRQFERWCEFVNEAHLHWSIERGDYERFPAYIREGRFGDFRVANLTAHGSHIRGTRGEREIAKDVDALYNLLYVVGGSICLIIDGNEVALNPSDIVLWDTTRPMIFVTGNNLHQVTLAVTHDRLHRIFPDAGSFVGTRVHCSSGLSRLFADHLLALDQQFGDLTSDQAWTVLDTTLNLAVSTFESGRDASTAPQGCELLRALRNYIDKNIEDVDILRIARSHDISVRHVHRIFHEAGITASAYISKRRLERCRQDLSSRVHRNETITDIAFRWGFSDSGTFSKIFRREYGLSPREFRTSTLKRPHQS